MELVLKLTKDIQILLTQQKAISITQIKNNLGQCDSKDFNNVIDQRISDDKILHYYKETNPIN